MKTDYPELKDSMPQTLKDELLSGQFSPKFKEAIDKMMSYAPELRGRAKLMVEGIFDTYERILTQKNDEIESVDDKDEEILISHKAAYVDISAKIIKQLPDLVGQIETGYGVKQRNSGKEGKKGNIMDDIRAGT